MWTVYLDDDDSSAYYERVHCDEWWEVLDAIDSWKSEIEANVVIKVKEREE